MIIENSQLAKNSFEKLKADLRIISNSLEHSASSGEYILRKKSNSQFLNCQNESFYREFLIRWKNHEYRKKRRKFSQIKMFKQYLNKKTYY